MDEKQPAPARLLICERRGRWAVALRRELAEAGVRVWETRTFDGCLVELAASPASFVILELDGNAAGLLRCLARQKREFPRARMAVVADRRWADYEWLVREAGAIGFLSSPRRVGRLAQLACRHLAQVPPPVQSLAERIWSGLPWGKEGTGEGGRGKGV
jgi:DNA-binding NarL/FixJ family response regulator